MCTVATDYREEGYIIRLLVPRLESKLVFVFSMKKPLFTLLRDEIKNNAQQLANLTWTVTELLDKLGLYTVSIYAQSREAMIKRQAQELLELSTPVVELWDKSLFYR